MESLVDCAGCRSAADCTYCVIDQIADFGAELSGATLANSETAKFGSYLFVGVIVARIVNLIPYYIDSEVQKERAHPIEGSFHPMMTGFISGWVVERLPLGNMGSAIGTILTSLTAKFILEFFNDIDDQTPPKLFCPDKEDSPFINKTFTVSSSSEGLQNGVGSINGLINLIGESFAYKAGLTVAVSSSHKNVNSAGKVTLLATGLMIFSWALSHSSSIMKTQYDYFSQGLSDSPFFFGALTGFLINKIGRCNNMISQIIPYAYRVTPYAYGVIRLINTIACSSSLLK